MAAAVDDSVAVMETSRLKQVRHWFEMAMQAGYRLPAHADTALARCLFVERNYLQAAEVYRGVLDYGGIAFSGEQSQSNDELNAALHVALASFASASFIHS